MVVCVWMALYTSVVKKVLHKNSYANVQQVIVDVNVRFNHSKKVSIIHVQRLVGWSDCPKSASEHAERTIPIRSQRLPH